MEYKFRYAFKRKIDGEIVYVFKRLEELEKVGFRTQIALMKETGYELVGRDLWTGLKYKDGREMYGHDCATLEYMVNRKKKVSITHSTEHKIPNPDYQEFISAFFYTDSDGGHEAICSYNRPWEYAEYIGTTYESEV